MFLNRMTLIVRAKQPYADWANSVDDGGPTLDLAEHRNDPNAYLVFDRTESGDINRLLRRYWKEIFKHELAAWMRDPKVWPSHRSLAIFQPWFDVELATIVIDLSDESLED